MTEGKVYSITAAANRQAKSIAGWSLGLSHASPFPLSKEYI